jgi:hypothetical protein
VQSSETVKPIPAIVPTPAIVAHPTGGCSLPRLSLVASHEEPRTPTGFPTTYPNRIPSVIGDLKARARKAPSSVIPAFASANRGTMT